MSTDDPKRNIGLEETSRAKTGNRLEAGHSTGTFADIWKFLNSNFIIWILGLAVTSSVVIIVDNSDQKKDTTKLEQKLDKEIAARVSRIRKYLRTMENSNDTVLNVAGVLRATGPVHDQSYPMGMFSEYAEYTLASLLQKLAETVKDDKRKAVLRAVDSARRMRDIEAEITVAMARQPNLKCKFILRIYEELDAAFTLNRWKIKETTPVVATESPAGGCSN